jgi:hypothetical protein
VRQLSDVFDLAAGHIDGVKFAGGSFMVMPQQAMLDITELCHKQQERPTQSQIFSFQRSFKEARSLAYCHASTCLPDKAVLHSLLATFVANAMLHS